MSTEDKTGRVIVTEEGEGLKHPDTVPAELIGYPVHTWRTKAEELFRLSNRRRSIIRRLIRSNSKLHRN